MIRMHKDYKQLWKFWWATGQLHLADRLEDCSAGQGAVVWVWKPNFGSFCCGRLFVCQVWLCSSPPKCFNFRDCEWLSNSCIVVVASEARSFTDQVIVQHNSPRVSLTKFVYFFSRESLTNRLASWTCWEISNSLWHMVSIVAWYPLKIKVILGYLNKREINK